MPTKAYIRLHGNGERSSIGKGKRYEVKENHGFSLGGLDPASPIEVRLEGDDEFTARMYADHRGNVVSPKSGNSVPQRLGMAMRGGEAFEVRCYTNGTPLDFIVEMEHNRFSAAEVQAMLDDLGVMDLRWDASSPIPTRVGDLEERTTRLVRSYPALTAAARSIFERPDEILNRADMQVPLRSVRRLTPTSLRANLNQGRLDSNGITLGTQLVASADSASTDTAANAYVARTIRSVLAYGEELKRQMGLEDRRLALEAQRERSYRPNALTPGIAETRAQELRLRLAKLRRQLEALEQVRLPPGWQAFRSRPDRAANAVRYDPRFKAFTRLASQVMDRRSEAARVDRLQRIAEFGRRPHNEIFEVWTVSRTIEALYKLGFRTARNPDSTDHREAFVQLEKPGGGLYGLRTNEAVDLVHKDAGHLIVRVGYEPIIRTKTGFQTPDVMVVLRGSTVRTEIGPARFQGSDYGDSPLYLDAKYQMLSVLDPRGKRDYATKYVELATDGGRRRPHSYVVQAAPDNFTWTQRKRAGDQTNARLLKAEEQKYFPYRVGVASMHPTPANEDSSLERRMPLVRVIYAWLVMQGVIAICPRCGSAMSKRSGRVKLDPASGLCAETFLPYLPKKGSGLPNPPRHTLDCRGCQLSVTANYCGACRQGGDFVPIIKVYPRPGSENVALPAAWVRDYEIAEPSEVHWSRHCPRCGSG